MEHLFFIIIALLLVLEAIYFNRRVSKLNNDIHGKDAEFKETTLMIFLNQLMTSSLYSKTLNEDLTGYPFYSIASPKKTAKAIVKTIEELHDKTINLSKRVNSLKVDLFEHKNTPIPSGTEVFYNGVVMLISDTKPKVTTNDLGEMEYSYILYEKAVLNRVRSTKKGFVPQSKFSLVSEIKDMVCDTPGQDKECKSESK